MPPIWGMFATTSPRSTTFWKRSVLKIWMKIPLFSRKVILSRLFQKLFGGDVSVSEKAESRNIKCLPVRNGGEARGFHNTCGLKSSGAAAVRDITASNGEFFKMVRQSMDTNVITAHKVPPRALWRKTISPVKRVAMPFPFASGSWT